MIETLKKNRQPISPYSFSVTIHSQLTPPIQLKELFYLGTSSKMSQDKTEQQIIMTHNDRTIKH